jgi:hypothetical protein
MVSERRAKAPRGQRFLRVFLASLLLMVTGLRSGFAACAPARRGPLTQSQVEAAFLYHFTKYVTWPPAAFTTRDDPIIIGVLGDEVLGHELEQAVAREKPVQGRPLRVARSAEIDELLRCHVLFIGASQRDRLAQHLAALQRAKSYALTVAEMDNFLAAGGAIRFVLEQNKVRFEIEAAHAERAGLTLSSRLLSLARNARARS